MAITIAKIPNRSGFKYKAHVKKNGKNLKIKTFTRKTDARTWAKRIEADFELMESLGCKGSSLTLSQLADEYLDDWSGKDTNQAPRVTFWVTVLGRYNLVDGLGRAKSLDRNPAPATINRYRAVLSSMLKYAVSQGYITTNPVAKVPTKALNNKIVRYLSDTERQDLLAACQKSSWKPFNYLMHLLEELPKKPDDLEPLLPWNVELEQKI